MKEAVRPQFGLESLMLVIALFAICAAVIRASVPVGVLLSLMSALALARTVIHIVRSQATDARLSALDKSNLFARSFSHIGIICIVGLCAGSSVSLLLQACGFSPALNPIVSIAAAGAGGYGFHRWITRARQDVES